MTNGHVIVGSSGHNSLKRRPQCVVPQHMIKSLKGAGICPHVSLIGIGFILFCVCCGDILFGLEVGV